MDNIVHSLVGAGMAKAGLSKRCGRGTLPALVLSSNIPDLDQAWARLAGGDALASRHTFTHSFLGVLFLGLLLAVLLSFFYRDGSWKKFWALCVLGAGVHVLFDLINTYGVVLFYPFSARRFELPWVFIVDPAMWIILSAPFATVLWRAPAVSTESSWRLSLGLLVIYVLFCGAGSALSLRHLRRAADREGTRPSFAYVFPEVLGCHRFRGVLRTGDDYRLYLIHAWSGRVEFREQYHTEESAPDVSALRRTPRARKLEWFFKAPVWSRRRINGKTVIEIFDLRFQMVVLKWREDKFVFRFPSPS